MIFQTKVRKKISFDSRVLDADVIDAGVRCVSESAKDDSFIHFIYCVHSSHTLYWQIKEIFSNKMAKYRVRVAILSMLSMTRLNLITKEAVYHKYHAAYVAEQRNKKRNFQNRPSLNDDLESFYSTLHDMGKSFKTDAVQSFFTKKLSEEELKLVSQKDKDYLEEFSYYRNPDEMIIDRDIQSFKKSSDPYSKYAYSSCHRATFLLTAALPLESMLELFLAS